jgi:DNA-binding transcriptional LysR family regulator
MAERDTAPARVSWELRWLLTLAAIGRERSFSRAAETLGYTQSAVSQQVHRLERAVGQRLVDRPGGLRAVRLTPAGELLLGHAEAIIARLDTARADLQALAAGEAGTLRVGCYQSVGVRLVPRVVREFQAAWPRVRVELTETEDDAHLLHLVERGELDLSFVVLPMMPGPFQHTELLEDPYVLVVRDNSPLGAGVPIGPADLAGVPLVTYAQMREVHAIENRLGRPELASQILLRSNDNGTILGLVAEGVGAAVISWLSADPFRAGLRIVPLQDVTPRTVAIAWHRDRYRIPAADAFVHIARQEAHTAGAP